MPLSSAVVILALVGDLEDRRTACSSASQLPEGARDIPLQYANRGIDFLGPVCVYLSAYLFAQSSIPARHSDQTVDLRADCRSLRFSSE
ncbi:hypothetical protein K466DRAFT_583540 [Polyporus arcularius HHB13444]|uniref:Uncharacterized protein n=1 Tax=Polyporus arcularius HHB13444 TaxID=1314778 RepID=A0A5C3PNT8_9APHY|nr:hypothetical protein K466DRAFT_583540 [Polyporus arcularius HHB13444]